MKSVLSILSWASLVLGSPLGSVEQYTRALQGRDLTEQNLDDLTHYAQHAGAAYCNVKVSKGSRISCSDNVCPDLQNSAVTVVAGLSGLVTGITGYVATDTNRKEVVLSVRGSNNVRNFITDVVFAWEDCNFVKDCKVHKGFDAAWDEISKPATAAIRSALAANPGYRLISTGHSLGGAVATLGAVFLRRDGFPVDVFSYGSPRVGNDKFADFVTSQPGGEWRVTHADDPVPRLPPLIFGYRHTSPEYWLSTELTSVDYPLANIKTCPGTANLKCNGGTLGLNVDAHLNYFIPISSCEAVTLNALATSVGGSTKAAAVSTSATPAKAESDEDLEERLNRWSKLDQDLANAL